MTLPYTFEPGTVAASSEVNANFSHIMAIVGNDSTDEQFKPDADDIILGPRASTQITAKGDTGPGASSGFLHVSWNAELYDAGGGVLKYRRFVTNEGGMALRVGHAGVEILGTTNTASDLNEKMDLAVNVHPHDTTPWIYLNQRWRLRASNEEPELGNIGTFRNTLVLLDPACELIPQASGVERSTVIKDVRTLPPGPIPKEATALLIYANIVVPSSWNWATLEFRPQADGSNADYKQSGFRLRATSDQEYEAQGIVRVGRIGNYEPNIQFSVDYGAKGGSDATTLTCGAWVQGYFV